MTYLHFPKQYMAIERKTMNKRGASDALSEPFSEGLITATGERVFVPIRKKQRIDYSETRKNIYLGSFQSRLSYDESVLVRMQNHIQVTGDDLCGPILHFQDLNLAEPVAKRLFFREISVLLVNSILAVGADCNSNASHSHDSHWP